MKIYLSNESYNKTIYINETLEINSFNGLCIYFYHNWIEAYDSDFITDEFIEYVRLLEREAVINTLGIDVEDIKNKAEIMTTLVEGSALYSDEEIFYYKEKLNGYIDMESSEQYKMKGDYFYRLRKYEEAKYWYEKVLELVQDYRVLNNLGIVLFKLHQKDEAIICFKDAFEISKDLNVLHSLIILFRKHGMYDEALSLIFDNFESDNSLNLFIECGRIYSEIGEYENALTALYNAYEIEDSAENLLLIIEAHIKMGDFKGALLEVEKLKGLDYLGYILNKSIILEGLERWDEAQFLLEEALVSFKEKDDIFLRLSRLSMRQGNLIKAISYINDIEDKDNDYVRYEMACIAKKAGNYDDYYDKINQLVNKWKKDVRNNYRRNG